MRDLDKIERRAAEMTPREWYVVIEALVAIAERLDALEVTIRMAAIEARERAERSA